jgi:hypothetical protein
MLLPIARVILEAHTGALAECEEKDLPEAVKQISGAIATLKHMFPELTDDRVAAAAE